MRGQMVALCCAGLAARERRQDSQIKESEMNTARLRAALAGFALGTLATSAQAANQAAAAADHLQYTLTDLAPTDAAAPAVVFSTPVQGSLDENLTVGVDGQSPQYWAAYRSIAEPAAASEDLSYVHGGAGFLGQGTSAAEIIEPRDGTAITIYQRASLLQDFRLAPYTAITFTMDLGLDLRIDLAGAAGGAIEDASGSAMLYVEGADHQADQVWLLNSVSTDPYYMKLGYGTSVQQFQAASVTLRNDSAAWMDADYGYDTYVIASARIGTVTPVPEPAGWTMLAAGCGLLVVRLRGRARSTGRLGAT
jgi:hypothetical protein